MIRSLFQRTILRGALFVAVATVLVKATSFVKDVVVAWEIGLSSDLDVFLFGITVLELIVSFLINAIQYSFIPVVTRAEKQGRSDDVQQMFSSLVTLFLGVSVTIVFLFMIFGDSAVHLPGADQLVASTKLAEVFQFGAVIVVFAGLSSLAQGVLQAHARYFLPTLSRAITPGFMCLTLLFWRGESELSALLFGTVVGAACEWLVLAFLLVRTTGIYPVPGKFTRTAELTKLLQQTGLLLFGSACSALTVFVDRSFAAHAGAGGVSALIYGNKITSVTLSIGVLSLSTPMLPHLTRLWSGPSVHATRSFLLKSTFGMLLLPIPIVIVVCIFGDDIIRLLYERGAFTATDSLRVTAIQSVYILALPVVMMGIPANRMILAMGRNEILAIVAVFGLCATYILNRLLFPSLGLLGIAWTYVIVQGMSSALCMAYIHRTTKVRADSAGEQ